MSNSLTPPNDANALNNVVFLIVLFQQTPEQSLTYQTLRAALADIESDYLLILFDNTPHISTYQPNDHRVSFYSDGQNSGLPSAYNFAAQHALAKNKKYLVILDQDSTVSCAYIQAVSHALNNISDDDAVLVPNIVCANKAISPYTINALGLANTAITSSSLPLYAINSFSVISLTALEKIGFFDSFYWLDALDFHFFHRLHQQQLAVKVLPVSVEHNLSLASGAVAPWRLNNIARYEMAFYAECMPLIAVVIGLLRILARGIKRQRELLGIRGLLRYGGETFTGLWLGLQRRYYSSD